MVRCFIGVMAPEEIKPKILKIQNEIKSLPAECKFVEKENLHICLSFLGEVEESKIKEISEKLDAICSRYKKFEVNVSGIKMIPSKNYIRVLVLDVKSGLLETISKNIKNEIGGDVKPPHLTLCRVRKVGDKRRVVENIYKIDSDVGKFVVSSISLIKSRLRRTGPIYTIIHESELR